MALISCLRSPRLFSLCLSKHSVVPAPPIAWALSQYKGTPERKWTKLVPSDSQSFPNTHILGAPIFGFLVSGAFQMSWCFFRRYWTPVFRRPHFLQVAPSQGPKKDWDNNWFGKMQDNTFLLVMILLCRRCPTEFFWAGVPMERCLTNLRKFTV